jgi:hypothetical protein
MKELSCTCGAVTDPHGGHTDRCALLREAPYTRADWQATHDRWAQEHRTYTLARNALNRLIKDLL